MGKKYSQVENRNAGKKMKDRGKGKYVGKYKWILSVQNNNRNVLSEG